MMALSVCVEFSVLVVNAEPDQHIATQAIFFAIRIGQEPSRKLVFKEV